jgi:hypothetical protein
MRSPVLLLASLVALVLLATSAVSLEGWLTSREEGLAAAKASGKPVLVVTLWKDGV